MNKHLYTLASLVFVLVACQAGKELDTDNPAIDVEQVNAPDIIAEVEIPSATKTVLIVDTEGIGSIYWKPADEINVFFGTTGTHYVSQNSEIATSALFTSSDLVGSTEGDTPDIWGLYPYDANAVCDGSSITTSLPSSQLAVPGSFADDLFLTLGRSTETSLRFFNVCGGIKFSLSRNDIGKITLEGNNGEDLAGDVSISFVDGLPKAAVVEGRGQKKITLTPKAGGTFATNVNYYFVVLPGTLSKGFTMTFTTTGGETGTFNYPFTPVTIKRSVFSKKANIDLYATFLKDDREPFHYSKVLFLGNSITKHPIVDYWWGVWGMAASRKENDYVHKVMAALREDVPGSKFAAINIASWERDFNYDLSTLFANSILDDLEEESDEPVLDENTDLIVIRVGENTLDNNRFEEALGALVDYVSEIAPDARIVITNQFWPNYVRDIACYNVAVSKGATFVSINQFGNATYQERIGNYVYGDDGNLHMINHVGVAGHPSDLGMQAIANAILNSL